LKLSVVRRKGVGFCNTNKQQHGGVGLGVEKIEYAR